MNEDACRRLISACGQFPEVNHGSWSKPQCHAAARVCARFDIVDDQSRLFVAVNIEPCPFADHFDPDLRPSSRDGISGPGFTKTETGAAAAGAGAFITSTIDNKGALLSGSSKKDLSKDATGGLLRRSVLAES
jgi:hypothetical protein